MQVQTKIVATGMIGGWLRKEFVSWHMEHSLDELHNGKIQLLTGIVEIGSINLEVKFHNLKTLALVITISNTDHMRTPITYSPKKFIGRVVPMLT